MAREITPTQVLRSLLRSELSAFTEKVFQTLHPGTPYQETEYLAAITYQLTRVLEGEERQLVVTQPPRTLKSICTSVAFVAWALGREPTLSFICVSYSQDLALELARKFRLVVSSPWYRETFPRMRLRRDTEAEITTTRGGGRLATSIGGTLTGRGADIIVIDDPLKAEEAQSEPARNRVRDWYRDTLLSRFNDQRTGRLVLVMQRLHEDDLAGLIAGTGYHLDLPAIAVERQEIPLDSESDWVREPDDLLDPVRLPLETLERIRKEIGSLRFSAQFQQRPTPLEGNLVKREWFRRYRTLPEAEHRQIVQSWDVAGTIDGDYSVCTTWVLIGKNAYLTDVWRDRVEFPSLQKRVVELARAHDAGTILIEKAGLGLSLYQALREESRIGSVIGIKPEGDKVTRLEGTTPDIEAGHIHLPEDAHWLAAYLNELLAFPNGRHDDQVDSTSQFLRWHERKRRRGRITIGASPQIFYADDYDNGHDDPYL